MAERSITEATMDDDEKLISALRSYKQADADGVMCVVSRQAVDVAADRLSALKAERDQLYERLAQLYQVIATLGTTRVEFEEVERALDYCDPAAPFRDDFLPFPSHPNLFECDYDTLCAERDRMAAALREAEAAFRGYAALHASKSPPAIDKARANDILADRMLAALSQEPTQ